MKNHHKKLLRIFALILFLGFSLVKWIQNSPGFGASTPKELLFSNTGEIGTLFFGRQAEGRLVIFHEEKFKGKEGSLTLELEGLFPNGLLIFKELDGNLLELRPNLEGNWNSYSPIVVSVKDSDFQRMSEEGESAWNDYQKDHWKKYASNFLWVVFLATVIFTYFKKS